MCRICRGEYDNNIKILDCDDCNNLTEIPDSLYKLEKLTCVDCPKLRKIPDYWGSNLKFLDLFNCYYLTVIQDLPNLKKLKCDGCYYLTVIQDLPNLLSFECYDCDNLTEIKNLPKLKEIKLKLCYPTKFKFDNCSEIKEIKEIKEKVIPFNNVTLFISNLPNLELLTYFKSDKYEKIKFKPKNYKYICNRILKKIDNYLPEVLSNIVGSYLFDENNKLIKKIHKTKFRRKKIKNYN